MSDEALKEIKEITLSKDVLKAIENGNFVYGFKSSMKALNKGKAVKIVLANNIPEQLKEEITKRAQIAKVPVEMFAGSNMELGAKCKRAHSVLVMAVTK